MKKMTEAQEAKWNYYEEKISKLFWGIVAVALVFYGMTQTGGVFWSP